MDEHAVMEARRKAVKKGSPHWRRGAIRKKDKYTAGNRPKDWSKGMDQTSEPNLHAIIPVNPADEFPVDARRLHAGLGNTADFPTWWSKRIRAYGFREGADYAVFRRVPKNPNGGRPGRDYKLTIGMAKELCMVERSPLGRRVRAYFLECERAAKEQSTRRLPENYEEALEDLLAGERERKRLEAEVESQRPRVAFADTIHDTTNTVSMAEAAQKLGWGHYRLMARLRDSGVLIARGPRRNHPKQRYVDAGYLKLDTGTYDTPNGDTHQYGVARVTGKGLEWLHGLLNPGTRQQELLN